jgi:macrolide-specific efflux system membrane fusion protein
MIRLAITALIAFGFVAEARSQSDAVRIPSALVKIVEQVEVPAREAGVLAEFAVCEGQIVAAGAAITSLDDAVQKLDVERARIELAIARRQAEDDVNVRFAKKSVEVAQAEKNRADESIKKFPKSISNTELDRLRLTVEKSILEVERATSELKIARHNRELKENEVKIATENVARRQITSPVSGVVVEVQRRRGEWVQPGQTVVRILRIDLLRAEAFIAVEHASDKLAQSAVKLLVDLPGRPQASYAGKVVFVSPEVDPVNRQVRIWAEIDNHDRQLRPGFRGTLIIQPKS